MQESASSFTPPELPKAEEPEVLRYLGGELTQTQRSVVVDRAVATRIQVVVVVHAEDLRCRCIIRAATAMP